MKGVNNKRDGTISKVVEALGAIVLVNLGFYLAFLVRFDFNPDKTHIEPFIDIIPWVSIATIIIFYTYRIFTMIRKSFVEIAFTVMLALLIINVLTVVITFFNRGFGFPRSIFVIGFFIQSILLITWKMIILKWVKYSQRDRKILVIGPKSETEDIVKKIFLSRSKFNNVKYICNNIDDSIYGLIDDVDKVYLSSGIDVEVKSRIIDYCFGRDKVVYVVPGLSEIALSKSQIVELDDMPILKVDNLHLSMEKRFAKRALDLMLSSVGLLITAPIMLIVAIIIKIYDRGPIFFTQERITIGGKPFNVYKFRSMVVNAEEMTGPVLATDKDPRITPLGRFIRATRLDELPQLINIFKGDMSIVGPRPERQHFIDEFSKDIPNFRYRTTVKAGLTGLAQVLGKYTTNPKDKLRFDLLYINNYSLLLDINIIFQTIKIMFVKESSSGKKDERTLEELLDELNIRTYEEIGVTKLD